MRTAYDESMEMLLVLLLLTYAEKDNDFKEKLLKVLSFYRENRDLLVALAGQAPSERPDKEDAQKNSPPDGGENLHVLEEFLKKI